MLGDEVFAETWKRLRLVLLPKPGKPSGEPSSLHLLNNVRRLECLSNRQFGIGVARSTVDAVTMVTGLAEDVM